MGQKLILDLKNNTKAKINRLWLKNLLKGLLLKYKISGIVEIGILIVGERKIRNLNRKFRKIDRVTDVLSFPQPLALSSKPLAYRLLGDIVICWSKVITQAGRAGHSAKKELQLSIEHGLRHLIGIHHK